MFGATSIFAQFTVDADIRPRTEIRNGSKKAMADTDQKATINTSQRSRLNMNYKGNDYSVKVSLQDVRTWNSANTMNNGSENNFDLHEVWTEVNLTDNFALKGGRQEVSYDDQRIMGAVGWAQQARSHDMGLLKYNGFVTAHVGFAYTSDAYTNSEFKGQYEYMNYLWLNKDLKKLKVSMLMLNKDDLTTTGGRLSTKVKGISLSLNYYTQSQDDLSGSLLGFDGSYKLFEKVNLGVGYESISGSDEETLAFAPVFGTNHKFNGFMDLFYVGNHGNSVGLNDTYFSLGYKLNKLKMKMAYHMFNAVSEMTNEAGDVLDGNLGSEIDLAFSYPFNDDITFGVVHSIYTTTESMQSLRGGDLDGTNSYSYFEVSIKPKFLN